MKIRYKIWLEKDGQILFGKGREELLEAIDELHSLSSAAKRLKMSYRAAWGRLRASEERLGFKLVEKIPAHKGMRLTPEGKNMLDTFKELRHKTRFFLDRDGYKLFPLFEKTAKINLRKRRKV